VREFSNFLAVWVIIVFLGGSVIADAAAQTFKGAAIASDTLGCGLGSESFDLKIYGDEFQVKIRNFTDDRIITGNILDTGRKPETKWRIYTDFGYFIADGYLYVRVLDH
jgi:hypothetical protein